ncbi:DUF1599 domain-containing protein [Neobacillus sp. YIM B02564]|uniref:DUF1599 domain-containing protein n=2 Tax=Neobacillus paridis TaxID=2803862 RepID=A0ABS1TII2_9BACI|nr:DUF1599 domain-containing protein [Neobacillus paridis]
MKFIYKGNRVSYDNHKEVVKVVKCDYLNKHVEVQFNDGSTDVVGFEKLTRIENDNSQVIECKEEKLSREQLHRNVIEEIHKTFKIKNADYGNSFGEQYEEYGLLSALIRLDDKMRRLKQLNKQEAQVKDESIRDTLLDLANYSIMTIMELDKEAK